MRKELSLALLTTTALSANAQDRPNIVLFLVDDMGWQETSVPFWTERTALNERYNTPNMERLANMGVKFTRAYACAISSPSRCSLLSGMNAARHRVTNWTLHYDTKTDKPSENLTLPEWNYNGVQPHGIATPHDTAHATLISALPQILRDNGYYTIHCGKAHFGAETTSGADPVNFGFDVNIAGGANGAPGSYLAENEYGQGSFHVSGLEKYYGTGTFLTEALTLEAIDAMKKSDGRPFFLYMSHYAIHSPYNPDSRFTGNYTGVDPLLGVPLNEKEVNHAALIEGMDKSLGDILDYLQSDKSLANNTIVIFMSDNGGQAVGPRQGQKNRDQNYPARGGKGSAFEGGVHEPMLLYWPGVSTPGSTNTNLVMIEDFFPTILEMAGIESYNCYQKIDGRSFVKSIKHPSKASRKEILWHFPNIWGESADPTEGYGAYSAIMVGDWHLIRSYSGGYTRLYNVRKDIGEQHDLYNIKKGRAKRLERRLDALLKEYNAQLPQSKSAK